MKKILLVEDEAQIRNVLHFNLKDEGYLVTNAIDGYEAIQKIKAEYFDLVLLDLMLPKVSGLDVLDVIMLKPNKIPTIIISAKNQTKDRIIGLKKGADDYINKPFDLEELMLRIGNVLQRKNLESNKLATILEFGNNSVNVKSLEAKNQTSTFNLTKKECEILQLLYLNDSQVTSRVDILKKVWGFDIYPNTRTIDNFLLSLRKYFEEDPKKPKHFLSVRGIGYKFIKEPK